MNDQINKKNTDTNSKTDTDKKEKKTKKKGPIRIEAIVPSAIIVGLLVLYFLFLFDWHLKKTIEIAGGFVNGGEVNIENLDTSFTKGTFLMENIEVTNVKEPSKNIIQIGKVHFKFLLDALLRAKFVIETSGINDIQIQSPRKEPGKLYEVTLASTMDLVGGKAYGEAKKEFSGVSLQNAGKILEGFDPSKKLKDLGKLKSLEHIETLEKALGGKEKEWNDTLGSFPADKELSDLQNRIKSIKVGGNNPSEIKNQLSTATGTVNEAKSKIETVNAKAGQLIDDQKKFANQIALIDDMVKKDTRALEDQLDLPRLDSADIAKQLFGNALVDKVAEIEKYKAMARKYMPPDDGKKKVKEEKKDTKPARGAGKTYHWGRQNSYPAFWLKLAEINSKASNSQYSGDIEGKITDVCSNPPELGKPTIATLKGSFPTQKIFDVSLNATLDHTKIPSNDHFKATVGKFPVPKQSFSDSESLKLGFDNASGKTTMDVLLSGENLLVKLHNEFRNPKYVIEAKSKIIESTLNNTVKNLPILTLTAQAKGTWAHISWSITSNLTDALAKGLKGLLQAKLSEARDKLKKMIEDKIGGKKKALTDKFTNTKDKITSQVNSKKEQALASKKLADSKVEEIKKQATKAAAPAKKAVDQLKKKLKF